MAKLRRIVLFSQHFGVDPAQLARVGAFEPNLTMDTPLFINPLLLARSRAIQMEAACRRYREWFEELGRLLRRCQEEDDEDWKHAYSLLHFKEPPLTCLGLTAEGIKGRGIGDGLALDLTRSAHSLVKSGTTDEDLMVCLPFLCRGLGPDRISDMVTQIVMQDLASYTQSALDGLYLPRTPLPFDSKSYQVPLYKGKPVLLVPSDILAEIQRGHDVETIKKVGCRNKSLRKRLSKRLEGMIRVGAQGWDGWVDDLIRLVQANNRDAIAVFRELVDEATLRYDSEADPSGHIAWRSAPAIARRQPLRIQASDDPMSRARRIVEQFGILLQEAEIARLLYLDARGRMPRPVDALRRLFFAIATTYCEADGDMLVEHDTTSGLTTFLWRGTAILTVDVASSSKQSHWRERYDTGSHSGRIFVLVDFDGTKGAAALALMNERRRRTEPAAEVQVLEPGSVEAKGTNKRFVKRPRVKCQWCHADVLTERLSRHELERCDKRPAREARR